MQLRFANLNDDDSNDRRSDQKALVAARQPRAINDHQFTGPQVLHDVCKLTLAAVTLN